jgi:lysozyme
LFDAPFVKPAVRGFFICTEFLPRCVKQRYAASARLFYFVAQPSIAKAAARKVLSICTGGAMFDYSGEALKLTEQFEGCKLEAYQDCCGVWTIGYGHTYKVDAGDTCTPDEAEAWLREDVARVVRQINRDVKVVLNQNEFDALVDFGFNLGVHALESSTLWRDLEAGNFEAAAAQFARWDKAGGKEVEGLLRRRQAERAEFLSQ